MEGELIPNLQLEGHEFTVWSLALTHDGMTIISGGQDATIRLWETTSGKEIHKFVGHDGPVYGLILMPDGKKLVSIADKDLAVRIWDLETKTLMTSLAPNSAHINAVAVSPDQRYIVTGGDDGIARFWDIDRGIMLRYLEHSQGIYSIVISPDGRHMLCGSKKAPTADTPGLIWVWDFELGVELKTLEAHKGHVTALAMTADSRYILSGGQDGVIHLWDLETGTRLKTMTGHSAAVVMIHITNDGQHVITGSNDGTVRAWLLRGGVLLQSFTSTENVHSMTVTPDGRQVITGSMDGNVEIWDFDKLSPWIDRTKDYEEEQKAELEAFRMFQLKKVITRYDTLPLERLLVLLRFDSMEELEDWLLDLPSETPVKIDGPLLVVKK
ncbi:MAG: WD40 repeat domain-containing protein [Candidatus Thorarchaeota archaeon]